MSDTAATWHDFFANLGIFRDAILAGGLAGALLGFLGVHVVLRRMVFASSPVASVLPSGEKASEQTLLWPPSVVRRKPPSASYTKTSSPRVPTAILSTGLMLLAFLSLVAGLVLDTVTRGRREMKLLAYLAQRAPGDDSDRRGA